jgi:hypothetical protein
VIENHTHSFARVKKVFAFSVSSCDIGFYVIQTLLSLSLCFHVILEAAREENSDAPASIHQRPQNFFIPASELFSLDIFSSYSRRILERKLFYTFS